ncbi:MAG: TetR family transcriptional regulator [Alteromonas sp.]|nr:TetR family transcriptional regulator [Alteromonas sp.]MAY21882.1 TetR family transcriptional regulator [Flavobacteriaceae bacterium]|tara:strand:- start:67827 stop:68435 length:609 start_codon:yes stop_codon:yes gene_type:complete
MKEKIIQKSAEMFINLGFKSVTMDDIAQEMGISKKTIYSHFKNKTQLVKETVLSVFHTITCGIDHIIAQEKNPIEELYEVKKFAMLQLKNEKASPQYQLQKYYPEIYKMVQEMKFENMNECTVNNLQRGVSQGFYRKNINIHFISRIYFLALSEINNETIFPPQQFPKSMIMEDYLEYHLRGIVTDKGKEILNQFINTQTHD